MLTVLAGVNQILRLGQVPADRVGPMIDGQVDKMEHLLHGLQGFSADSRECGEHTSTEMFTTVEFLLRLAGKGCRFVVSTEGSTNTLERDEYRVLGRALQLALLAFLPPRAEVTQVDLRFEDRGLGSPGAGAICAELGPPRETVDETDLQVVRDLLRVGGWDVRFDRTNAERVQVEITR